MPTHHRPAKIRFAVAPPLLLCAFFAAALLTRCSTAPMKGLSMNAQQAPPPLASADMCAFAATTDAPRCRAFYEGKLGLKLVNEDAYGLVFESNGVMLRMQKGPEMTPVPRTV